MAKQVKVLARAILKIWIWSLKLLWRWEGNQLHQIPPSPPPPLLWHMNPPLIVNTHNSKTHQSLEEEMAVWERQNRDALLHSSAWSLMSVEQTLGRRHYRSCQGLLSVSTSHWAEAHLAAAVVTPEMMRSRKEGMLGGESLITAHTRGGTSAQRAECWCSCWRSSASEKCESHSRPCWLTGE